MVFAIHQHESAVGVHVCPCPEPFRPPPSPPCPSGLSQSTSFEFTASCIELALIIYFTYGNVHVSRLFSQIIPPSLSPTESKSLFFTSLSHTHTHTHHMYNRKDKMLDINVQSLLRRHQFYHTCNSEHTA